MIIIRGARTRTWILACILAPVPVGLRGHAVSMLYALRRNDGVRIACLRAPYSRLLRATQLLRLLLLYTLVVVVAPDLDPGLDPGASACRLA